MRENPTTTSSPQRWFLPDTTFFWLIILGIGVSPDSTLAAAYFLTIPYFWRARPRLLRTLALASGVALAWTFLGNGHYRYAWDYLRVGNISFLPFFAWALGLTGAFVFTEHAQERLQRPTLAKKLLLYAAIYYSMLIAIETIVYHLFLLKNAATAAYPGLPLCNCIHAPRWMQVTYGALGPLCFGLNALLESRVRRTVPIAEVNLNATFSPSE